MQWWQRSASEVLQHLRQGELSSVELFEALDQRRRESDGVLRAFVHLRPEARAEALRADERRKAGEPLGPLHGLLVTVKDNIDVAGCDSTMGLRSRVGKPAAKDAVVVRALREAGAIIYGKTNVPQLLLSQECENLVFGRSTNPWNSAFTPGGSSGGEAAAVAAGSSLLGMGTDVGGSVRIPAHFCGLAGLRPSPDRWSNVGSNTPLLGQELVRSQVGALARRVGDLSLLWQALDVSLQANLDPAVAPLPAGDPAQIAVSKLRVGFALDDPYLPVVPAIRRATSVALRALELAGVELIAYQPCSSEQVIDAWLAAVSADGGAAIDRALAGERLTQSLRKARRITSLAGPLKRALATLLRRAGDARGARLLESLHERSVAQYWDSTWNRTLLRRQELERWQALGLDAFLGPAHCCAALPHGRSAELTLSLAAQFRWALLGFPAGVVPVTRVLRDEAGSGAARDPFERKLREVDRLATGLPVGAQLVARPFCEEVLLALMQAVEDAVRPLPGFPHTPVSLSAS